MTQDMFLNELKMELEKRKVPNISDILSDYKEHFEHARSNGKSDREVIQSLGPASTLAQAFQAEIIVDALDEQKSLHKAKDFKDIWRAIGMILILTPFNFFMLVIPGVIIFSLLATGWSMTLAVGSIGLASLALIPAVGSLVGIWHWVFIASTFFGLLALTVFLGAVMFIVTTWIGQAVVQYLRWNLRLVLEK